MYIDLQYRLRFFDSLLDLMPVEVAVRDVEGHYTLVNRAWEDSAGLRRADVLGKTAFDLFPFTRAQSIDGTDREALALGGKTLYSDFHVRGSDGAERYLSVSKTAMLDADGKVIGVLSTATDVTARREAEQALKEQIKLTRDLIEANPLPIYLKDTECRYIDINAAFVRDSGLTPERALGRTAYEVLSPERARQYDMQDRELLARGEGSSVIETEVVRPEGSRHFMINKSILRRSDGTLRGLVGSVTEVTALKRVEAELRASREEALQAAQAKAVFLATMSHEIRTPLNGVIGMTGILLDTALTPEQRDYVETIRDSGETLLSVINDILDFSKIESGRLELEREPLAIARVIEQGFDMLGESVRAKRIELLYQIADDVPAHIYGDSTCLRQIIVNLAGNAVKFTDSGEVLVDVRLRPADADQPAMIEFCVIDTGIGIPADRLHVLFRPFTQVDASTTRKYGGTGLGLAICKRLTELMGGTITAASEPGRGSTFTFTIRCDAAPAPPGTDTAAGLDALTGRRILIVDDNASNLRILGHQLKRWGMRAEAASGGRAALELLARGERFDAAIVDNQMPGMDGVALARAIKKRAARARLPVVLLSSSMHRAPKATNLFAARLLKPTRQSQLFDALVTALTGRRIASRVAAAAGAVSTSFARHVPLRILVVDDHEVNRRIARLLLAKLGYRADTAAGGRQAVAAARRRRYDVVLMDVQMPEMDGFEATREIGAALGGNRPVVIAMTANVMEGDRERCLAAGMDDYVGKPLEVTAMQAALERWGRSATRPAREKEEAPAGAGTGFFTKPSMNWSRLDELREYDNKGGGLVRKVVGVFMREAKARILAIGRAIRRHDAAALASAAHALKGAALNVGADALAEVCAALESWGREGRVDRAAASSALLGQRFRETARVLEPILQVQKRRRKPSAPRRATERKRRGRD